MEEDYFENLNERVDISNDVEIKISPIKLDDDTEQFLLIYEANKILHNKKIKQKIVQHLHGKEYFDFECYINSTIYFRVKTHVPSRTLNTLEADFLPFVSLLEVMNPGAKIFWIFNHISKQKLQNEIVVLRKGKGNSTLNDRFQKYIAPIITGVL